MATEIYSLKTSFSDGSPNNWPKDGHNFDPADQIYHQKLAALYLQEEKSQFERENPTLKCELSFFIFFSFGPRPMMGNVFNLS